MPARRDSTPSVIVRIIGGTMRGRKLAYRLDRQTRPMKDRVREALFNLLGPEAVTGAVVWDLFAGTGALSLEAISRGADRAVALEQDRHLSQQLQRHAQTLGIADRLQVIGGRDTLRFRDWPAPGPEHWLVFCCPPYALYYEQTGPLLRLIAEGRRRAPAGSIVVVETDTHFDLAQLPDPEAWRSRNYPPAVLAWSETGRSDL